MISLFCHNFQLDHFLPFWPGVFRLRLHFILRDLKGTVPRVSDGVLHM